jgi:peptide/nickel transport system substrate-binding protein
MPRHTLSLLAVAIVVAGALTLVLGATGSAGANLARDAVLKVPLQSASRSAASTLVLTAALAAEPDRLDPALTFDNNAFLIGAQIYETLITYAPNDLSPLPGLADTWSVSADGKTWTFNIPPGIKFHDGTTLDAFAVAANFNRWWDPANPHHTGTFDYFGGLFGGFKGDPDCWLLNVEAPDAATFRLTLKRAYGTLPVLLGSPALGIASPAAFDTLDTQPVGSGPFKFANWLAGNRIELIANPHYHGRAPQLDALTFTFVPDEAARLDDLAANRVQVAFDISSGASITGADLRPLWRPALNIGYLGLNRAHGPLGNALVRQAIAHAIDKAALLANHYRAGDEPASQFLPPALPGYNATIDDYDYDPNLARSLLTQAGYPNGFNTTLALRNVFRGYLPDPVGTANAIAADLQAVGITATVLISESNEFLNAVWSGQTDLFLLGWFADYPSADNFFGPVLCDQYLAYGAKDTVLCNMIDQARATTDYVAQLALYRSAAQRVYDTLPVVPLAHGQSLIVARRDVAAFWPSGMGVESFGDTYLIDPATSAVDASANGEPWSLDPALDYDVAGGGVMVQMYEPLLTYKREKTDEFLPLLATQWTVSPDERTYTFTLRPGVRFHNGAALDPEDVAFSFWRGMLMGGPDSPQWMIDTALLGVSDVTMLIAPDGSLIGDRGALLAQPAAARQAACEAVKRTVTFNAVNRTVTFHLPQAHGPFLSVLATPWGSIMDKDWLITYGPWDGDCATWASSYAIAAQDSPIANRVNGTGPYMLDYWISNDSIGVTRNPLYWRQISMWPGGPSGPASIPHVTIRYLPDATDRANLLLSGEADWGPVDAANAVTLSQHVMLNYDGAAGLSSTLKYPTGTLRAYHNIYANSAMDALFVYSITGGVNNYLGSGALDGNGIPPDFFTDLNVRKAFNYAFDWQTYIADLYGGAAIQRRGPIIKTVAGYRDDQPTYFYSPTLALQAMSQAWGGQVLTQGFVFTLPYRSGNQGDQRFAEILKVDLEALSPNFHVNLLAIDFATWRDDRRAGRLPLLVAGWLQDIPHPSNWVYAYLTGVYPDLQRLPADQRAIYQAKADACLLLSGAAAEACYADIQTTTYLSATDIFLAQSFATQFSSARLRGYYVNNGQWDQYFYALSKGDLPVIETATPTSTVTIPFTSTTGTTANVQVPAGAVTQTMTIVAVPDVPAPDAPGGFQLGNLTFNLQAYVDNTLVPSATFASAITLTLHYNDQALGLVAEDQLLLLWWNGSDWVDAACGPYQRDLINNVLTVPICHFSQFSIGGTVKVGLIVDGPTPFDGSFNEMAYQGLQRAQTELGMVGTVYTTTSGGPYEAQFAQCAAEDNALCVGVGFSMADAGLAAASAATTTKFAVVDYEFNYPPGNLRGITFAEDEAGYLAGVLAGKMTASHVVGAVAGWPVPAVERFVAGYRHGFMCSNSHITATALITYANTFTDPALGAQIAQQQIANRADVIFNIAGLTGNGAILTATQSGKWAIGVDADQYVTLFGNGAVAGANKLLSSAMKRVDNAVFSTIADMISGTFTSGNTVYRLNDNGVGLAPFHGADAAIPPSAKNAIEAARLGIINGTLDVNDDCREYLYLPLIRR